MGKLSNWNKLLLSSLFAASFMPLQQSSVSAADAVAGSAAMLEGGWSSAAGGTTGGASADPSRVYTVTSRAQLIEALGGTDSANNAAPKIIYVQGTIDMNVDDNNQPVDASYYADPGYDFNKYLAEYDPQGAWGTKKAPSGPQEDARLKSQKKQAARIQYRVGSNTSIIGIGTNAKIVHGNMLIDKKADGSGQDNIIVSNVAFEDAYDYFPQWDPTDGAFGNWNSMYDLITVKSASHVWIDHCDFSDGGHPDSAQEQYFSREYQHHDGTVDITNASNYVTVSYSRFHNHDKTMLIGSSDTGNTAKGDEGKLKVTLHHNYFDNVIQRLPRVRFGQVHVYNNYYKDIQSYVIGRGVSAQVYSEANYFENVPKIIDVYDSKGTGYAIDNGSKSVNSVTYNDWTALDVWNGKVNWVPGGSYAYSAQPAEQLKDTVLALSGTLKDNAFADLNGHWVKSDVEWLFAKKLVNGKAELAFAPQNSMTRAEFTYLLVKALSLADVKTVGFADVKPDDWYAGAVGAAVKAGLVDGFADGTFQPNAGISREQLAMILSRAIHAAVKTAATDAAGSAAFTDGASIGAWAKEAVTQAVKAGIVNGFPDGTFQPAKQASRAEAAVMLKRFVQFAGLVKPQ